MKRTSLTLALAATGLAITGCNAPVYYEGFEQLMIDDSNMTEHVDLGMWVQTEYWLDFDPPTPDELDALQPAGSEPADMIPWVQNDHYDLSIQWRLENTADEEMRAWVTLDGATEFFDWNPIPLYGMAGGEDADEIPFPSLLGYTPLTLEPGQVMNGEFREDDTIEAAFDADVLTRFCGGPLAVIHNRSEVSDLGLTGVPEDATIAGLVLIRLTLGSSIPGATLDYNIRIRDHNGIMYDAAVDDERWEVIPEPYVPASLAAAAPDPMGAGTESEYCMAMQDDMG